MGQLAEAEVAGLTRAERRYGGSAFLAIERGVEGKVCEWEEVAAAAGGWQWHVRE
jgi:hypothetical protein